MSEVKGTLLSIVLAVSMFAIVFGIIQIAMNKTSNNVAQRMVDTSNVEVDVTPEPLAS